MKNYILTAALTLLMVFSVQAAERESALETVRDLISLGLEENIGLQVEQLNVYIASDAITIDEAFFDAEMFASAGYSDSSTPLSSTISPVDQSESAVVSGQAGLRKAFYSGLISTLSLDTDWTEDNTDDLDPRYRSALNLNLTQPLLRNFGSQINTTDIQISRNRQSQSSLLLQLQAQDLAQKIEILASRLAGESHIVLLRTEAVALAKELYASNKRRFDAGVIPVSEVQEAETALASRELELSLARQSRELNFENLNRQLNHRLPARFDSTALYSFSAAIDQPALPLFETLYSAASSKNINLQLAEFDIRNAEIQQTFFQNQVKPQLDLSIQAGVNGLSGDERIQTGASRYAGSWDDSFSSAADADGYQWGVGLEFSIPLGNRVAKSQLQQTKLQRRQSEYNQRDLQSELKSQLQKQSINLQRAYEQVKLAEKFEQLAKLTVRQEQRRLDEGLSDTFRMILFQNSMINAKIDRINALSQYYLAVAQLDFVRGIILEKHNIVLRQNAEEKSLDVM